MADLNVTSTLMLRGCATHLVLDADCLVVKRLIYVHPPTISPNGTRIRGCSPSIDQRRVQPPCSHGIALLLHLLHLAGLAAHLEMPGPK